MKEEPAPLQLLGHQACTGRQDPENGRSTRFAIRVLQKIFVQWTSLRRAFCCYNVQSSCDNLAPSILKADTPPRPDSSLGSCRGEFRGSEPSDAFENLQSVVAISARNVNLLYEARQSADIYFIIYICSISPCAYMSIREHTHICACVCVCA